MRPIDLLLLLLAMMVILQVVDRLFRRRRARQISGLCSEFHMNYSALDRFGLTERLMILPQWTMRASDLSVKDVLYATRQGMRCFVATAKCRWSLDQDASRFIVKISEPDDHQTAAQASWERSENPQGDVELYRNLLREWCGDESTADQRSRICTTLDLK